MKPLKHLFNFYWMFGSGFILGCAYIGFLVGIGHLK